MAFVLFWATFTLWLLVQLVREYLLTNVAELSPEGALLSQAISMHVNFIIIATVLRYLHRLGEVRGRQARDAVVTVGLLVSIVALGVPWGVAFDADTRVVTFRTGFWIGEAYYMLGLLYAVVLAWVFALRRPRNEAPAFLLVMGIFASAGLIESAFSLAGAIMNPMAKLGRGGIVFSSIPYAVYGIFLVVNGGVEESSGRARGGSRVPAPGGAPTLQPAGGASDRLRAAAERLRLSEREREVVTLVLEGRSNQQIADRLYVSLATVKTHLYRIYRKAEVPSRYGLIRAVQGIE